MIHRLAVRITRSKTGHWVGQLAFQLVNGRRHGVTVNVDENAIRDELAREYMPEPGAGFGFFAKLGRWLKKTAQKVARWKVWKVIGKVVKAIVNNPIVGAIVGVASTIFPPLGATYLAAKGAVAVADKVAKGVTSAINGVVTVAEAAAKKNPIAAQALSAEKSPLAQFIPT